MHRYRWCLFLLNKSNKIFHHPRLLWDGEPAAHSWSRPSAQSASWELTDIPVIWGYELLQLCCSTRTQVRHLSRETVLKHFQHEKLWEETAYGEKLIQIYHCNQLKVYDGCMGVHMQYSSVCGYFSREMTTHFGKKIPGSQLPLFIPGMFDT